MVEGRGGRRKVSAPLPTTSTTMQTELKPREQWDEDEVYDGRQKTSEIDILVFAPAERPALVTIPNTLSAMQAVVGGTITCFQTGIEGICPGDAGRPACVTMRASCWASRLAATSRKRARSSSGRSSLRVGTRRSQGSA
jgi:hypothetical protein